MTDQSNMTESLDPQMDRLLGAVGTAWCEEVSADESTFVSRFEGRLRREKEVAAEARKPVKPAAAVVAVPRRRVWIPFAIAASVLIVIGIGAYALLAGRDVGSIYYQRGQIVASGATTLHKGDRLVCNTADAGIVALDKGRVVLFLANDTLVEVTASDRVRLNHGSLWAVIKPKSGFFEVATPNGSVDVHGTTFGVIVDESGTRVSLLSGAVTATTPQGTSSLVPGQEAALPPAGSVGAVAITQTKVATPKWVVDLEAEAARERASKFFPSGAPRSEPHGGLLPCTDVRNASL